MTTLVSTEAKHSSLLNDITILYLTLPIALFIIGWVNYFIAGALTLVSCYLLYKKFQNSKNHWLSELHELKSRLTVTKISKHLLIFSILAFWLIISGWGNFVYQHTDFIVRNATLGALVREAWPVHYTPDTYFCYYFASNLPAALIGKISNIQTANIILVLWLALGLYMSTLWIHKITSTSYRLILFTLLMFGGLTTVRGIAQFIFPDLSSSLQLINLHQQIALTAHQAIPIILLTCQIIEKNYSNQTVIIPLTISACYSPLSGLVILFLLLVQLYHINRDSITIKSFLSIQNTLGSIVGCIFLVFMSSNKAASNSFHIILPHLTLSFWFYIFTSFLFYLIFVTKKEFKSPLFISSVVICLIFPCVYIGCDTNDFLYKSSTAPTLIILISILQSIQTSKIKKLLFVTTLIIGGALLSLPLGLYCSCTDALQNAQKRLYSHFPNNKIVNTIKKQTLFSFMKHQNDWENTMYHPDHKWNNNFVGEKNNITKFLFRFN